MIESIFKCITDPKPKKKAVQGSSLTQEPFAANTNPNFSRKGTFAKNADITRTSQQDYSTANVAQFNALKLYEGQNQDTAQQSNTWMRISPANNSNFYTPNQKKEAHEVEGSMDDIRVARTAVNQNEEHLGPAFQDGGSSHARTKSMFSWADSNQRQKEPSKRSHSYHPADIEWSEKEIKQSRQFAMRHINLQKNAYEGIEVLTSHKKSSFFRLNESSQDAAKCGPSCQKDHIHSFEYDFTKNYMDPISQRPGIDFDLDPKIKLEVAKVIDQSQPCEFGKKQTPINLSSQMEVLKGFEDKEFKFHYDQVNQKKKQLKFNQTGDAFFFDIAKGKSEQENPNCLKTQTISLFDPHIPSATLHGVQFHFHAPSEHSIDGKLLDLEMHIVHLLDKKREHNHSQFGAGVLGFFFKVMPEEYFEEMNIRYPQADIEWHDRFMLELVTDENERAEPNDEGMGKLDLAEFVKKVDFNKRWTYQGSLTTAPCDEGILWNVVEGVIPIRQSTLDMYTKMRKVEEEQLTNKLADQDPKTIEFLEELKEDIPASKKSQKEDGNTFMRVAGCNRKVQDQNGRAVYRINLQD